MERIVELEEANKQLIAQLTRACLAAPTHELNQVKSSLSTNSAAPLLNGDLEVLLVFLCEVMKPRALASSLPTCDNTNQLTHSDCMKITKGFDYLSKTSTATRMQSGHFLRNSPPYTLFINAIQIWRAL
ncbi:hypothetical protein TrLO_g928 [Triparma laevis f. longispina]|uniref:Uncharacterized protein n=1 Tax=Triparma laevis f. longispina TaxID=1714387 RepID=A0A9W7KWI3_9STRA|nr:hypothetical protein TrLO_g928 [Triparma laevis f. longispina]